MGNFITCNNCEAVSLPEIGATRCGETVGQIQIAAFVKMDDLPQIGTGSTAEELLSDENIVDKANWESALSAATPKVQMSPLLCNPSSTPGDARVWGGGNASIDGEEHFLGLNPTTLDFEMRFAKQKAVKAMKELRCLAERGMLGVLFFNGNGEVIGVNGVVGTSSDDATMPIRVSSIVVKDKTLGGYDEPDYNSVTITLPANWSDDLKITSLTDGWTGKELLS